MAYNWPAENLTVQEKVGVGTETPTEKLEVKGNLKLNTGVAIGEFSSDTTFATPTHQAVPTTQAVKTYVNAQVAAVTTALATKAEKGGSLTQSFQTDNLTVQGNLEVTGQTTFRNIEQHQGDLELGNEDTDQVKIHGKLLSTHSSGTLQVVSPLQVVGTITANKFVGDGSDLTGLSGITQWFSGAGGTLFYNGGNVGIGIDTPQAKLDVKGAIRAGNSDIYFSETNHNHTGLGNPAGFAAIENAADYGALMILGRSGTPKGRYVRLWDYLQVNGGMDITGNMGIGTATPNDRLDVAGGLRVLTGANPIRFTSDWSGFPDAATNQAEISNDTGSYKTLMIVGNKSAGLGRRVSIWDRLEVNGQMNIYSGTNPAILRIQSASGFGAARIEFWSDPQGSPSEWRPSFIQSTDQGTWTGGLAFFVNGQGIGQRTGAIEVMRINQGVVRVNGIVQQSSSRSVKENIGQLSAQEAVTTLEQLSPVKFNYKADLDQEQHIGFIAEEVPDLVASLDRKFLSSMDIVAVLTKVLQEQQQTIATLADRLNTLEAKQG